MHNRKSYNRLSRTTSHRKALIRNQLTSFFKFGKIETTKAKAIEVKRFAEKMITRAKVDSVHNRREIARKLYEKDVVATLFNEIAPKYESRNGGYTRILKLGQRKGDAAEVVILELV